MGWKFRKKKKDIPGGVWLKCQGCNTMLTRKKVEEVLGTCPECGFHFKIDGRRRVDQLLDEGSFEEFGSDVAPVDHLEFFDKEPYAEKLKKTQGKTGLSEAATVGRGRLDGLDIVFGALDFSFMGGSMGVVVGERVTLAAEVAREEQRALVERSAQGEEPRAPSVRAQAQEGQGESRRFDRARAARDRARARAGGDRARTRARG